MTRFVSRAANPERAIVTAAGTPPDRSLRASLQTTSFVAESIEQWEHSGASPCRSEASD